MRYRRYYHAGGTYFFTLVAHKRQPILTGDAERSALRGAVLAVREKYPFEISAWVLMPDHLHTIWHLLENDAASVGWVEAQRKPNITKLDGFHDCWVTALKRPRPNYGDLGEVKS